MADRLTKELIDIAIAEMIPVIESSGSARVGWALSLENVLGKDNTNAPTHLNKVAGKICADGKYKYNFMGRDCWIHKNHEYELNENIINTNNSLCTYNNRTWIWNIAIGAFVIIGAVSQAIDIRLKLIDRSELKQVEIVSAKLKTSDSTIAYLKEIIQKDYALGNIPDTSKAGK